MKNQKTFEELSSSQKERYEKDFHKDLSNLNPERQSEIKKMSAQVDQELDEINKGYDEGVEIENKFRKAGYLPSHASNLLHEAKNKKIGEVFKFFGKEHLVKVGEYSTIVYTAFDTYFVKTPFNTVVAADIYIKTVQDQLLQVADYNNKLTSGSFFDLIKLAFKRLFTKG